MGQTTERVDTLPNLIVVVDSERFQLGKITLLHVLPPNPSRFVISAVSEEVEIPEL